MADASVQTYANHRRFLIPWHFVVLPILAANAIVEIVRLVRDPGLGTAWRAIVAIALLTALICARWMARTVQDRVIRLEETQRLGALLPGRAHDIERLSLDHFIAIRFASDDEVPHLVDRILSGDLTGRDDVKRAIQHWRSDYLRV